MKKLAFYTPTLLCLVFLFNIQFSYSQCTNTSSYLSTTAPTNSTPISISSCTYFGDYNTVTGVAAATSYTSTVSPNGCITVHQGSYNGPVVGFGTSPLTWTSTVAGTYYIHYNVNCGGCGTNTTCHTTTIACNSCGAGPNPCTSITNIAGCGTSVTANLSGSGAGWSTNACGFSMSGQEQIYSFTPTTTGTYSLNVTTNSGGYIDYFWINSTSGCSSSAPWNCIADITSPATVGSMSWTAGQTYYILVDPETTGAHTSTFSIVCPSGGGGAPCSSITNIVGCGASYSTTVTGTGSWATNACGFTMSGVETVYSYTATSTGNYSINVSSISGGFIDIFYVNATAGCSSGASWTCIDDVLLTGSTPTFALVSGQTYYFLIDPEDITTSSMTFNLVCPTGTAVTASDCTAAVNICSNASFQIDPNGYGATMEIPPLGSIGNPYNTNPGGSGNEGCLQSFVPENNSTWMVVNIATSGDLEFSFGAGGAQAGFYDWIMYPYNSTTCADIPTGNYAPVRCNWNWSTTGGTGCATSIPSGGDPGNYEPPLPVVAGEQYVICFSNYSSASTSVPLDFFGTATVSCTPLNSELVTFNGKIIQDGIQLNWTTQTEINSSHFNIERSTDGLSFEAIGVIDANGNSNITLDYNFIDENPVEGMNYYRLVSVDYDQSSQMSQIIPIDFAPTEMNVDVYPNPSDNNFNIAVQLNTDSPIAIEIFDVAGKKVFMKNVIGETGRNNIEIPANSIAKGFYNLRITNLKSNSSILKRIYKQ